MRFLWLLATVAWAAAQTSSTEQQTQASVDGKVTSTAGQPLAKARITLRKSGLPPQTTYSETTAPDGMFQITGVEAGSYLLTADRTGYMPQAFAAKPGVQYATGTREILIIKAGQKLNGRDIQMVPATTLSGKVLDEDGDPVERVQVRVLRRVIQNGRQRLQPTYQAITDPNGEYRIPNLTPDKYYLAAALLAPFDPGKRPPRKPGEEEHSYVDSYYPGVTDAASASTITTVAGRDLPDVNIPLKKAAVYHVRGHVTGVPAGGMIKVFARPVDELYMQAYTGGATVREDGSFDLPEVMRGTSALTVMNQSDQWRALARRLVTVSQQDIDDMTIALSPPLPITGRVRIEGEEPPPDGKDPPKPPQFVIRFVPLEGIQNGSTSLVRAETDGSFSGVRLSPGKYLMVVSGAPNGAYWKGARRGVTDLGDTVLDTEDGNTEPLDILFSRNGASVTATVTADGEKPTAGVCNLLPELDLVPLQLSKSNGIDANGQCVIKGVLPGAYRMFAMEENDISAAMDPGEFRKMVLSLGVPVTVKEKDNVSLATPIITEALIERLAAQTQR